MRLAMRSSFVSQNAQHWTTTNCYGWHLYVVTINWMTWQSHMVHRNWCIGTSLQESFSVLLRTLCVSKFCIYRSKVYACSSFSMRTFWFKGSMSGFLHLLATVLILVWFWTSDTLLCFSLSYLENRIWIWGVILML